MSANQALGGADDAFTVRLDRSGGQALGMEVIAAGADAIEVKAIKIGGLVEAWNAAHPAESVRPGDVIVRVNSCHGPGLPDLFLAEVRRFDILELVVVPAAPSFDADERERLASKNRALRAELDALSAAGEAFRQSGAGAHAEFFSIDISPTASALASESGQVEDCTSKFVTSSTNTSPASPRSASTSPCGASAARLTPSPLPVPQRELSQTQVVATSPLPTSPGSSSASRRLSGSTSSRRSRRGLAEVQLVAQDRRLGMARPVLRRLQDETRELLESCSEFAGEGEEGPEVVAELERMRSVLTDFEHPLSALLLEAETAIEEAAACGEEASRSLRSTSTPRHSISRSSSAILASAATPRSIERKRSNIALEGAEALLLRGKRVSWGSDVPTPPLSPLQRATSAPAGGLRSDSPGIVHCEPKQLQEVLDEDIPDSEEVLQLAQVIEELTDALEEAQGAEWAARRRLEESLQRLRAEQEVNARGLQGDNQEIVSLKQRLTDLAATTELERERAASLELEFMRLELQTALAQAKAAALAGKKGFSASWQYKT